MEKTSTTTTLVIISGASKGFGRSLTLQFASLYQNQPIEMLLLSRDEESLKKTQELALSSLSSNNSNNNSNNSQKVAISKLDLSDLVSLEKTLQDIFKPVKKRTFEAIILKKKRKKKEKKRKFAQQLWLFFVIFKINTKIKKKKKKRFN